MVMTGNPVALVCVGAVAGAAFVVIYHKFYYTRMRQPHEDGYNTKAILSIYEELEKWGLDYGSSMADNYFYGYLNIILPPGHSGRGFEERVKEYKISQKLLNETFPDKLFVVLHKSGFSPNTYEQVHKARFWARKKMLFEVEGRNGIMKRTYQTSVYKISSADKSNHITVVMEGAPCLRQMYESSLKNPVLRKLINRIIEGFMVKLKEKIDNDPHCRSLCELVYFDDTPGLETTGKSGYDWLANEFFRRAQFDPRRRGCLEETRLHEDSSGECVYALLLA